MLIKALTRTIIEWDADQGRAVVINKGEVDELADAIAQHYIDALDAELVTEDDAPAAGLSALDHDGDGAPGGDLADDIVTDIEAGLTLTDTGGGWWSITGPEGFTTVKVRGEEAARARYDEIVAAAAATEDDAPAA